MKTKCKTCKNPQTGKPITHRNPKNCPNNQPQHLQSFSPTTYKKESKNSPLLQPKPVKPLPKPKASLKIKVQRHSQNLQYVRKIGAATGTWDNPWNRYSLHAQDIQTTQIAGITHRSKALQSPAFNPGKPITLIPEPTNEYDPNAIGIWSQEEIPQQIGWIPAEKAAQMQLKENQNGYIISEHRHIKTNKREALEIAYSKNPFHLAVDKSAS